MSKIRIIFSGLIILGFIVLVIFSGGKKSRANITHTQIYPQTKVMMIDYMTAGWNSPWTLDPTLREFMATHYDAVIGGVRDYTPLTSNPPVNIFYANYYMVGYVGNAENLDAQNWAAAHGVNFEDFYIHYSQVTHACYGSECYDLPAGSRVPSYGWYGTGGDLTKAGARVIANVGNPNYRAWRLDYLSRQFTNSPNADGVFIDNTTFSFIVTKSTITSGGTYQEYPTSPDASYGNGMLTLFSEFKVKFGSSKVQIPNVSNGNDDPRMYPYIWGAYRESTLQTNTLLYFPGVYTNIDAAEKAGVQNLIGGFSTDANHTLTYLAEYYLFKRDSTYFFPFLRYVADQWGIDPRQNQWFDAVSYNIGQPKNDPTTAQKYKTYYTGIDPGSVNKDTMNATSVVKTGYSYRLTDPSKSWTDEQWKGKAIVFPSGFIMQVYHSGSNWIDVYNPSEVPQVGTYKLGDNSYSIIGREFDNALVLYRQFESANKPDDTVTETLPVTSDNPSGVYYSLKQDGTVDPTPVTTVSLRSSYGVILIKVSTLSHPSISKKVDKSSAQSGDTLTYTVSYSNPTANAFTNARIEDPIPDGTTFISAANGGTSDGAKVIWNLGTLAAGTNGSVTFQVKIP